MFLSGGSNVKKIWILILLALMLSGCSAQETFETVGDDPNAVQVMAPGKLTFAIPADASSQVMYSEAGMLYFCDGYEIMVLTMQSGDLNRTLRSLTGYDSDGLTVIETKVDDMTRYECIWLSAGEMGDQIGRTVIIDDGRFHYSLSVIAPANEAGSLQQSWQEIFSSIVVQA